MGLQRHVYVGAFAHCRSLQELDICPSGAIGVGDLGKIEFIDRDVSDVSLVLETRGWKDAKVVRIKGYGFFFPGFVDTHIHASQYPNAGIFGKSTLLDWLDTYTFPMESSFASLARARQVYTRVVARTLAHGTTTAAYYATVHVPATNLLADLCHARGQRAFIGRVCMDTPLAPEHYRDPSPAAAIAATEATNAHIAKLDPHHDLLTPILTPRFAPSCTADTLAALANLHRETGLPIQTHLAENQPELALVRRLFPDAPSYTHVYDAAGLLTPRTVLAHAVYVAPAERKLIAERGSAVAHCPVSNTALASGAARVRRLMADGVTVGLGTDVSGGFSASVLVAAREAVLVSRLVAVEEGEARAADDESAEAQEGKGKGTKGDGAEKGKESAKLMDPEVLWMATRGGAKALGLQERIGGFEVGMEWDAQMVVLGGVAEDGEVEGGVEGAVDVFGWESWEERISKWLYNGDDRNTLAVWVKGRLVHETKAYPG
ncbi:MAG: hypothetical protein M1822_009866 [Bathelium mastoideum]|nr:MAG: hypothetical protein M1822_009866 [Bathelium mastoideum]